MYLKMTEQFQTIPMHDTFHAEHALMSTFIVVISNCLPRNGVID